MDWILLVFFVYWFCRSLYIIDDVIIFKNMYYIWVPIIVVFVSNRDTLLEVNFQRECWFQEGDDAVFGACVMRSEVSKADCHLQHHKGSQNSILPLLQTISTSEWNLRYGGYSYFFSKHDVFRNLTSSISGVITDSSDHLWQSPLEYESACVRSS